MYFLIIGLSCGSVLKHLPTVLEALDPAPAPPRRRRPAAEVIIASTKLEIKAE
jgi:hypothetical protein